MGYPTRETNIAEQKVKPAFISVATYAAQKGISPAQARREAINGLIPHIRCGDRILIPADEPERQAAAARAEFEQRRLTEGRSALNKTGEQK